MKNIKFLLAFTLTFAVSQSLFSQVEFNVLERNAPLSSLKFYSKPRVDTKKVDNFISLSNLNGMKVTGISQRDLLRNPGLMSDTNPDANINKNVNPSAKKERSPVLGGLMSAVLPGSGEFYGGNLLKAAIFLGIEIAGWGTYAYLQHKGDTKTTAFEAYANQYWSIHHFAQWLDDQFQAGLDPNKADGPLRDDINNYIAPKFSHTVPDFGSQQFYELIGKYQEFQGGWTNLAHVPTASQGPYNYETYRDPVFVNYAYSRQDANNFYDYANTGIYFVVLNHLLSAADAVWTVSTFNRQLKMQTGFRINRFQSPFTYQEESMPTVYLAVNF